MKSFAIYFSILILGIVFAIAIGLNLIIFGQMKIKREIGYSINALSAADSGIERGLYEIYKENRLSGTFSESFDGASFEVKIFQPPSSECPQPPFNYYCIKSIGSFKGIFRKVESSI